SFRGSAEGVSVLEKAIRRENRDRNYGQCIMGYQRSRLGSYPYGILSCPERIRFYSFACLPVRVDRLWGNRTGRIMVERRRIGFCDVALERAGGERQRCFSILYKRDKF